MFNGKRRAIIVGINKYKDPKIPELKGAENDAREIYDRLKDPDIGNFEVSNDHYLTGKYATCKRIHKAIIDIFRKSNPYDLALFYFSGHAFEDGYGNGYIAPYDMLKDEPYVFGIKMEEIKNVLSESVNKSNVIIIDSCYSRIISAGDK